MDIRCYPGPGDRCSESDLAGGEEDMVINRVIFREAGFWMHTGFDDVQSFFLKPTGELPFIY
uniref:Uncharacterized protein n=1 Tax=Arundo donax TaxID=35708 RepID=A0A0A9FQK0_ARUDO